MPYVLPDVLTDVQSQYNAIKAKNALLCTLLVYTVRQNQELKDEVNHLLHLAQRSRGLYEDEIRHLFLLLESEP